MDSDREEQEHAQALSEHKKMFDAIIAKYGLGSEANSSKIADLLTSGNQDSVTAEVFAAEFGMEKMEAIIFLSWIQIGVQFKSEILTPGSI